MPTMYVDTGTLSIDMYICTDYSEGLLEYLRVHVHQLKVFFLYYFY